MKKCMACGSTERELVCILQNFPEAEWWICRDKGACRADSGEETRPL